MGLWGMRDFTYRIYRDLIGVLKECNYTFQTFETFTGDPSISSVVLRHDVDKSPENALYFSRIENSFSIKGSYHFRAGIARKYPEYLREISALGHEIAYHYEDLSRLSRDRTYSDRLLISAMESFRENLSFLRQFYPVKVISMHGDPLSGIDNRHLWKHFSYREEGIICEPYLDIDYTRVLYLTDTGRRWNGSKFNLRDKIMKESGQITNDTLRNAINHLRTTEDLIELIKNGLLPELLIINTHPQRWNDNILPWTVEFILQNLKNPVKYFLRTIRADNE